jgi:isoleucyl-tRNA synthetase
MPPHMTDTPDFKDTVFLPKTDFPMKAGLPQKEPAILARWQEQGFYEKLRDARRGREKFILHDGPPYANGDMHIGHALNHILKDMVVRTQTLLGKDAPYVPGWDCHGLPIEWKVEEQYRKKKLNKDEVPVKEFRAECRAYAQNWVDVQREQLKRLGINADWDNPYLTMDFDAEATIVTELMKFAESGQLYRGAKPVMWSPVEKTALAEAEVEYEDITSTQIDVAFEIVESPIPELVGAHAVIWTTTPWTIPVNQAIAYGPEVEYKLYTIACAFNGDVDGFEHPTFKLLNGRSVLIANNNVLRADFELRLSAFWPGAGLVDASVWEGKGSDLAGTIARHPIYNYLRRSSAGWSPSRAATEGGADGTDEIGPSLRWGDSTAFATEADWKRALAFYEKPRPFLPGDFVTTDSGTGLVHMSPDHGEDDFDLCKANGIDPVFAVEGDGKYRADWAWLGGQGSVINPKFNSKDGPILQDLAAAGALLVSADYKHSYPHSWRSKAKVIYRCTPQWFVPMDKELNPSPLAGEERDLARNELSRSGEGDVAVADSSGMQTHADPSPQPSPAGGEGVTLRSTAMAAIADTRWVPEKGRNRINSMVEGRPDWVLSRQRAWGVPITLFVDRKTGAYLCDAAVNARIIAGVREVGVDAWCDERAQEYLGEGYALADYERVVDILDVWFDSGCTHAFVLESGKWPDLTRPADHIGPWADLYLEGTDQHRGWFQSSLLESCGTRGHAPYKAVLTHGFTMDQKGMKMSKSLGNTINPLDLMRDSGADILRLWALTVDFTEDHRIGKEILQGVSDQYRKLRNTFRYMLGALDGFSEAERVAVEDMPELERYVLHLLADMDAKLRQAVDDFDFNTYVKLLTEFANNDLSAFFFDIRKDCLYCDAPTDPKRMAYRTVLDILFHALVRYAAPVLVFTAEEVWQTRFGADSDSVHFSDWPELPIRRSSEGWSPSRLATEDGVRRIDKIGPSLRWGDELMSKWERLRAYRGLVSEAVEPLRREKLIGSSLEATVRFSFIKCYDIETDMTSEELAELCISSNVSWTKVDFTNTAPDGSPPQNIPHFESSAVVGVNGQIGVQIEKTTNKKCGRCWRHLPEVTEDGALCNRCDMVLNG